MAKKIGFDILARMPNNKDNIEKISSVIINILKQRSDLTKDFMEKLISVGTNKEYLYDTALYEVLLECREGNVQKQLCRAVKYGLCQLKMDEFALGYFTEDEGNEMYNK